MRQSNDGTVSVLMIVVVIVVAALISAFVLVPYFNRADDYANDPDDPPEEVEDQGSPPDWMGQFELNIHYKTPYETWGGSIAIRKTAMTLEPFDGEPWSVASFATFDLLNPGKERYEVKYDLTLSKGRTSYTDEGKFWTYKDDDYKVTAKTKFFFFWEEQEGNWSFELTVKCEGKTATATGTLGISDGKAYVN